MCTSLLRGVGACCLKLLQFRGVWACKRYVNVRVWISTNVGWYILLNKVFALKEDLLEVNTSLSYIYKMTMASIALWPNKEPMYVEDMLRDFTLFLIIVRLIWTLSSLAEEDGRLVVNFDELNTLMSIRVAWCNSNIWGLLEWH